MLTNCLAACAHLTITVSEIERDICKKIIILSYPLAFDALVKGVPVGISPPRFVWKKLEWWGYPMVKKIEDIYNGLDTIPACDRRTSCHGIYALCIRVAQ